MLLKLNAGVEANNIEVNTVVKRYSRLEYHKNSYVSGKYYLQNKLCVALVKLPEQSMIMSRAVHLLYFVQVSANINNDIQHYILSRVLWLKEHNNKYAHGKPLELWWKDLETGLPSFIPLEWLAGQCVYTETKYEEQTVLLLCPI